MREFGYDIRTLQQMLSSQDSLERREALGHLAWEENYPEHIDLTPQLLAMIEDEDPSVREAALDVIGVNINKLVDPENILMALVNNPSWEIQMVVGNIAGGKLREMVGWEAVFSKFTPRTRILIGLSMSDSCIAFLTTRMTG